MLSINAPLILNKSGPGLVNITGGKGPHLILGGGD